LELELFGVGLGFGLGLGLLFLGSDDLVFLGHDSLKFMISRIMVIPILANVVIFAPIQPNLIRSQIELSHQFRHFPLLFLQPNNSIQPKITKNITHDVSYNTVYHDLVTQNYKAKASQI
jgi:hypothetical protein